jgi:16S rRNA (cytosine1402-N4)-methyltransferase
VVAEGHQPVMLAEALGQLAAGRGGRFLDGTFGGGGHTRALLEAHPATTVVALDCDAAAVARGRALESEFDQRLQVIHSNFAQLETLDLGLFDGVLFDFGLSSYHYDTPERGFSFRHDGPLDMRLDDRQTLTAAQFLERADHRALVTAIRDYGEEPRWRQVVAAIEAARGSGALARTTGLAALIGEVVGTNPRRPARIHPATRSFQGIRIAVNDELAAIAAVLPAAFARLLPGGRLVAISFHSLEDRLVKRFMRRMAGLPETSADGRPAQTRTAHGHLPFNRPLVPTEEECELNPRARSARLRTLIKGLR